MLAALALLLALSAAPVEEPLALNVRKPIELLLVTPTGNTGSTSSSEIIRVVSELLSRHTDLSPALVDPALVADCKGRLSCFARKVRAGDAQPELLLVLTKLTQGGAPDRLSVDLVDLRRALELDREARHDEEEWESELEARVRESAVLAHPKWVALANEQETRSFLTQLFAEELRRAFEETGSWEPYGALELAVEEAGLAVEIDGVTAGITRAGLTRVVRVPAGKRVLRLSAPKIETYQTEVVVERGKTARVEPALAAVSGSSRSPLESGLFWAGAGAIAAGAVITTVAVARSDGGVETYCIAQSAGACATGQSFRSINFAPDKAPTFGDEVNPRGLLLAPLGYSTIAVGLTWSLATVLFDARDRFPWIELAAGLAAGAATYFVSAALDGPHVFSR